MKNPQRNLVPLLMLLVVSQLSRLLKVSPALEGYHWQVHDVSMHFSVVALLVYITWITPYRDLAKKWVLYAWTGFEIIPLIESVLRVFEISAPDSLFFIQVMTAICFSMFYAFRSYQHADDILDDKHIFICRLRPKSVQGVLLSMLAPSGMGGVGVYCHGYLYHYREGILVCTKFINNGSYVVIRSREPTIATIRKLNQLIGTKWTLRQNCLTVLLWTVQTGSPLFRVKPPIS